VGGYLLTHRMTSLWRHVGFSQVGTSVLVLSERLLLYCDSTQLNSSWQREPQLTQFVGREVINKNTTDLAVRCSTGSVEFSCVAIIYKHPFSWMTSPSLCRTASDVSATSLPSCRPLTLRLWDDAVYSDKGQTTCLQLLRDSEMIGSRSRDVTTTVSVSTSQLKPPGHIHIFWKKLYHQILTL